MNPLKWKKDYLVGWFLVMLLGWIVGVLWAWLDSAFHQTSSHALSGQWANQAEAFSVWLPFVSTYWPLPTFCAIIFGLTFFIVCILLKAK